MIHDNELLEELILIFLYIDVTISVVFCEFINDIFLPFPPFSPSLQSIKADEWFSRR